MLEPSLIQFYIADEGFKLAQRFVNDREGMGKFTEIIAVSRNRRHAAVKRTANDRASHAFISQTGVGVGPYKHEK